jgi:2-polyprenyl-3-methyl-5-hydroxy-6-metoxy-1,4-benzoquinol methylase
MKELYQKIYDTHYRNYGEAKYNHCPGVRLYPEYKDFIISPVIDLGCGTGDLVKLIRENEIVCNGIDWIDLKNDRMVGDITEKIDLSMYNTCLCMDVIEHITDEKLTGLFENMKQTKRQIFSISNTPSWIEIDDKKINSHINDKPFKEWHKIINDNFETLIVKKIRDMQYLYITNKE